MQAQPKTAAADARGFGAEAARLTPLAVDMDHTLIRTDLLMEGMAAALFHRPLGFFAALPQLLRGRPAFKRAIAAIAPIDAECLPLREDVVAMLREERAKGRELHLVTAADEQAARIVALRVGVFQSVIGSGDGRNLKGRTKRRALEERFPEGFAYAGDSSADLAVWKGAQSAVLVGASPRVANEVRRNGPPIEAEFPRTRGNPRAWLKALRPHQWVKNVLIFAPLLLAHAFTQPDAVLSALIGFALLCVAASSGYIINDLADLDSDRRHATKRRRPFASGAASVGKGLILAPIALIAACAGAFALSIGFGAALLVYVATTFAYSMGLKRIALLDTAVLGALYTLRIIMGAEAAHVAHSQWLLTFAMFFFVSLSLAKRHVEVMRLAERSAKSAAGRNYHAEDWPLTLALGASAAAAAVLILVLYLVEEAFAANFYPAPVFLWAAPIIGALALGRIWLKAHRKQLDDDPAAFAVKDPVMIGLGATLVCAFALATLL
ncbi:MAG: UbiA family prenyltransferase [Hyphomonadaceae bacterium]